MSKCAVAVDEKSRAVIGQATGMARMKLLTRTPHTHGWCVVDA